MTQDKNATRLLIRLELQSYEGLSQIVERVRRIFDLNADPVQIANHLSHDPRLKALSRRDPGLRAPGVWDGFEGAVLAILGQNLSSIGRNRDADRLIKSFGIRFDSSIKGLGYLFPRPENLANADLSLVDSVSIAQPQCESSPVQLLVESCHSTIQSHMKTLLIGCA